MPGIVYTSLSEVNDLQTKIMTFVQLWVHEKKTPIPLREIISEMENKGVKNFTTIKAINILLKKGYIRRGYAISNKTFFVQLRSI